MSTSSHLPGTGAAFHDGGTTERVAQAAHETVDRVAESAGPAVERLKNRWDGAADTLHRRADQLGALQKAWAETCRTHVRESPLESVGLALAIGWMVGRLHAR